MSLDEHHYALTVRWTGNRGAGTSSYRGYSRDHDIEIPGLPAGEYTIAIWHETLGTAEQRITVAAKQAATVDFALPQGGG